MTTSGLATALERVADAIRGHEAFQAFVQGGGTINGRKCKNQYDATLTQGASDSAKEQSVTGQRCQAFGWPQNVVRLVGDALCYNKEFEAAKKRAGDGTVAEKIQMRHAELW